MRHGLVRLVQGCFEDGIQLGQSGLFCDVGKCVSELTEAQDKRRTGCESVLFLEFLLFFRHGLGCCFSTSRGCGCCYRFLEGVDEAHRACIAERDVDKLWQCLVGKGVDLAGGHGFDEGVDEVQRARLCHIFLIAMGRVE